MDESKGASDRTRLPRPRCERRSGMTEHHPKAGMPGGSSEDFLRLPQLNLGFLATRGVRSADLVLDVGDAGRVDCLDLLEPERPAVEPREQALTGAEDQRRDRDVDLVNQPCG